MIKPHEGCCNEVFGPTNSSWGPPTCWYWTSETRTDIPGQPNNLHNAWEVNFGNMDSQRGFAQLNSGNKVGETSVRAVRNV